MRNEPPRRQPPAADSIPAPLAAACARIRLAGPADLAPGGWVPADWAADPAPSYLAAPESAEEAATLLRAAAGLGLAVLPRGSGTRLGWGPPPRRCDLVVDMTRMNRVLEHAAGDLVARVQAGISLERLAEALATAGQRLALDPPGSAGSAGTIGGVLATGVAGPLRLRHGAPRDLLIGITVIRADGTLARAGGKVVKNVAGYDIGKLFAGSYGTLGLIAEATFRLHPRPAAALHVTLDCAGPQEAAEVMSAAAASPLAPSAAEIDWPAGAAPVRAAVLLEGTASGAAQRAARMCELLGRAAAVTDQRPPWWGRGAAAAAGGTVLRIAFWPGELAAMLSAARTAAAAAGLDPALSGSAAAGVLHAAVPEQAAPAAVAGFVAALRRALGDGAANAADPDGAVPGGAGPGREQELLCAQRTVPAALSAHRNAVPAGTAVVLHAPPAVRALVDMWGPVQSAGLMRAVKNQFDPEGRMAPGRFAGGI